MSMTQGLPHSNSADQIVFAGILFDGVPTSYTNFKAKQIGAYKLRIRFGVFLCYSYIRPIRSYC